MTWLSDHSYWTTFSATDLLDFVTRLHSAQALEFGEEEVDDIVREVQTASFLRRDRQGGQFGFMHRSFGEFFLARKILDPHTKVDAALRDANPLSKKAALDTALDTRRLDRKTIYFLSLLDEADTLRTPLQSVLTAPYTENVSENALQILYWSGRVRCEMKTRSTTSLVCVRSLSSVYRRA